MSIIKGILLLALVSNLFLFIGLTALDTPIVLKSVTGDCVKVISKDNYSCSSMPETYMINYM